MYSVRQCQAKPVTSYTLSPPSDNFTALVYFKDVIYSLCMFYRRGVHVYLLDNMLFSIFVHWHVVCSYKGCFCELLMWVYVRVFIISQLFPLELIAGVSAWHGLRGASVWARVRPNEHIINLGLHKHSLKIRQKCLQSTRTQQKYTVQYNVDENI